MLDAVKLAILGGAGVFAVLIIVIGAWARFRDELVNMQVISDTSKLGQQALRSQRRSVQRVLAEIGFRQKHFDNVRSAVDVLDAKDRSGMRLPDTRLDQHLVVTLKQWTHKLAPGFSNPGGFPFYVDTMGAMDYSEDDSLLANIAYRWVVCLQHNHRIPPADCLLTCKDGNITLVRQVCGLFSPPKSIKPIVGKGDKDHSLLKRTNAEVHQSDFEGLQAFLREHSKNSKPQTKYRAIFLDDNCTTAAMMCSCMRRFNKLVSEQNLPFHPVEHAITLFVIRPEGDQEGDETRENFLGANATLHSLLGLGDRELEKIINLSAKELKQKVHTFRTGYGCESSTQIFPK